ncbi:methyltransferase, TIGR04325 family [Paraburkholderia sp. C35]|jgi:putative methyltransferase (TIGR04325 family)|uniref:methyltransferase, TIGR04325 family n=1 Tax=Paraburkholderia sp. C35 TaxID=2126993 RepID=UPI0013A56BC3|nr:methyltransferase, TIGR04325 family [Paraburkholderia sp. C35]
MEASIRLRDIQIVWAAKMFRMIGAIGYGRRLIEGVGRTSAGAAIWGWILGYRRTFRALDEAERAVKPYAKGGHENRENLDLHLELNRVARPSDYAAFYYLRDPMPGIKTIFDLGGNVGNLYYCYKEYLPLRPDVMWTVYDLPETIAYGRTLASNRNIANLQFTDDLRQADGVDLFIASGSLQYFDKSLPELLKGIDRRPKYILINRVPMTEDKDFAVVQDAGHIRVACMLHNRSKLITDFERLGYRVLGEWEATELRLTVLDRPSSSVWAYTGLWLERV